MVKPGDILIATHHPSANCESVGLVYGQSYRVVEVFTGPRFAGGIGVLIDSGDKTPFSIEWFKPLKKATLRDYFKNPQQTT